MLIYTHVLNRAGKEAHSPVDRLGFDPGDLLLGTGYADIRAPFAVVRTHNFVAKY